jgi:hypothetical protein
MTVGLIMLALAIYAAQRGAYGIVCLALLAMVVAFLGSFRVVIVLGFVRLLRGSR